MMLYISTAPQTPKCPKNQSVGFRAGLLAMILLVNLSTELYCIKERYCCVVVLQGDESRHIVISINRVKVNNYCTNLSVFKSQCGFISASQNTITPESCRSL